MRVARFAVFCLEAYKRAERLSGARAAEVFCEAGLLDYLREGYEVLHSLGEYALVEDIRDYLRHRTGAAGRGGLL